MKIAICTSNGSDVDLHFGKTDTFYIYQIDNGIKSLLDKREVEKYSPVKEFLKDTGDTHKYDSIKFEFIYNTIKDCKKIYTVSIGEVPRQKLDDKGIEVQICNCPIDLISTCNGNCKPK